MDSSAGGQDEVLGDQTYSSISPPLSRFLSVGGEAVWAINPADEVFVRVNLSKAEPRGKEWTKIDGSMKARAANQPSQSFTVLR